MVLRPAERVVAQATTWRIWCIITVTSEASSAAAQAAVSNSRASRS